MRQIMISGMLLFLLLAAGCDLVDDRIGEQDPATVTAAPFSTATPGGRISVWMVSPTGPAPNGTPAPVGGQIVGPAATATAAAERIAAATATAVAPTPQPTFQTGECPQITGVSAPSQPANFAEYSGVIGVFLSNGGAPSVLESTLRNWGAITDKGGMVQADTDLTGDKVAEIIINTYNPATYNSEAILNAGRMMVFGCDNFAYRLLYITQDNPGLALPVLHRVGDMNADTKAELVFDIQSCTLQYCTREGQMLTWNPVVGVFEPLNLGQISSINGRLGVVDVESDGILELTVSSAVPSTISTGPTRTVVDIWDWNGLNYVLAQRIEEDARYRIHVMQDADEELLDNNLREALRLYQKARDDGTLLAWTNPSEPVMLRAFVLYRILTVQARLGSVERAEQAFATLLAENPEGASGAGIAAMGQAFIDQFRAGVGSSGGCQAALTIAISRPEILSFLNSYGTANHHYQIHELCPF